MSKMKKLQGEIQKHKAEVFKAQNGAWCFYSQLLQVQLHQKQPLVLMLYFPGSNFKVVLDVKYCA